MKNMKQENNILKLNAIIERTILLPYYETVETQIWSEEEEEEQLRKFKLMTYYFQTLFSNEEFLLQLKKTLKDIK